VRTPSIDDPDLPLSRLFEYWPATGQAFLERKLLCFGCPIAPFHTVLDAVAEYELDEAEFRARLRHLVVNLA
jgi:hybrid cluster-associated redox disulfide protein